MNEKYSTGEVIVRRGEISSFLYIVHDGRVRISEPGVPVFFLSKDDIFGEEGVITGKPAPYTAVAADETRLEQLKQTRVNDFFSTNPDAAGRLMKRATARAHETLENLARDSAVYITILGELLDTLDNSEESGPAQANISLISLAERTDLSVPSLRAFFREAARFGDVRLSGNGEIMLDNPEKTRKAMSASLFQSYFGIDTDSCRGIGKYNLLATYTNLYRESQ